MILSEIESMSVHKRISLMEELWDSLCHEKEEIQSPEWHKQILEERKALITSGKAKFLGLIK